MSKRKIRAEFKEASLQEIKYAILENFFFGLSGAIIFPFITLGIDIAVLIGYMVHFFYISKVINRPKYTTSLAKFILFPIPTALGAFTGYKIAYILSQVLSQHAG